MEKSVASAEMAKLNMRRAAAMNIGMADGGGGRRVSDSKLCMGGAMLVLLRHEEG